MYKQKKSPILYFHATCRGLIPCPRGQDYCPLPDILNFHRRIMTSEKALRHAMKKVAALSATVIAPQHGSVIDAIEDIRFVTDELRELKGVGIDGVGS